MMMLQRSWIMMAARLTAAIADALMVRSLTAWYSRGMYELLMEMEALGKTSGVGGRLLDYR